jgi:hypothetical protein
MKNTIGKILVAATFGLILNSAVMAGEDVDAFTLNFKNDTSNVSVTDVQISQSAYTPNILTTNSILEICYDTAK